MKKGIHPEYRPVVFQDPSCDFAILSKSTIKLKIQSSGLMETLILWLSWKFRVARIRSLQASKNFLIQQVELRSSIKNIKRKKQQKNNYFLISLILKPVYLAFFILKKTFSKILCDFFAALPAGRQV